MDVRYTSVRKGLVEGGEMIASNPGYATAVGLLMQGTKNCAAYIPPKPEPVPEVKPEPESFVEEVKVKPEEKKVKKIKKPSIFDRLKKNIDNMTGDLFDDEER